MTDWKLPSVPRFIRNVRSDIFTCCTGVNCGMSIDKCAHILTDMHTDKNKVISIMKKIGTCLATFADRGLPNGLTCMIRWWHSSQMNGACHGSCFSRCLLTKPVLNFETGLLHTLDTKTQLFQIAKKEGRDPIKINPSKVVQDPNKGLEWQWQILNLRRMMCSCMLFLKLFTYICYRYTGSLNWNCSGKPGICNMVVTEPIHGTAQQCNKTTTSVAKMNRIEENHAHEFRNGPAKDEPVLPCFTVPSSIMFFWGGKNDFDRKLCSCLVDSLALLTKKQTVNCKPGWRDPRAMQLIQCCICIITM